ncbi:MAG: serine hydrolase [bacterium]|nr:serine hydrolase [bacterium]
MRAKIYRTNSRTKTSLLLLAVLLGLIGAGLWYMTSRSEPANNIINTDTTKPTNPATNDQPPPYTAINLQPTIDAWLKEQSSAVYSISVYDLQANKSIGQNQPDRNLFAASLYKLYVAYLSLIDIQNGDMNPNEILSGSYTRKQCVDKMIRESYSPCGEAMMADIGQTILEKRVKEYGINNTTFAGITTSAQDSVEILRLIATKKHLNNDNTSFLLDAMEDQPQMYRNGLAKGAPDAKWATKVGWNESYNYHDVGIMTMSDGRKFAVAILSQGNGSSAPIADFAKTIYAALAK